MRIFSAISVMCGEWSGLHVQTDAARAAFKISAIYELSKKCRDHRETQKDRSAVAVRWIVMCVSRRAMRSMRKCMQL